MLQISLELTHTLANLPTPPNPTLDVIPIKSAQTLNLNPHKPYTLHPNLQKKSKLRVQTSLSFCGLQLNGHGEHTTAFTSIRSSFTFLHGPFIIPERPRRDVIISRLSSEISEEKYLRFTRHANNGRQQLLKSVISFARLATAFRVADAQVLLLVMAYRLALVKRPCPYSHLHTTSRVPLGHCCGGFAHCFN